MREDRPLTQGRECGDNWVGWTFPDGRNGGQRTCTSPSVNGRKAAAGKAVHRGERSNPSDQRSPRGDRFIDTRPPSGGVTRRPHAAADSCQLGIGLVSTITRADAAHRAVSEVLPRCELAEAAQAELESHLDLVLGPTESRLVEGIVRRMSQSDLRQICRGTTVHNQRSSERIRRILRSWNAKSIREDDGTFTFFVGLLSGVAYAKVPGLATLRCPLFIDNSVDKQQAEKWVDENDDAPFGGLRVFRDQDQPRKPGAPLPGRCKMSSPCDLSSSCLRSRQKSSGHPSSDKTLPAGGTGGMC